MTGLDSKCKNHSNQHRKHSNHPKFIPFVRKVKCMTMKWNSHLSIPQAKADLKDPLAKVDLKERL